ncbi:MAG: GNAT family N-acetyltransferase [Actinomycetota bacterium]|nr:GNAT family N-acetyltransferase [Actinomycetota bacterium]
MTVRGWPVHLQQGPIGLRPLMRGDAPVWREVRSRNRSWLTPWEATLPPGVERAPQSFRGMARELNRQARAGRTLPFATTWDGRLIGQVTVSSITWGSARSANIGYWIDSAHAGKGVTPMAVAMAVDHCFDTVGLHRIEVAIRPENVASLRVVDKLGLRREGAAPRYLHIDGAWRDHLLFAVTREEVREGLVTRLQRLSHPSQQ